ncbi:hypothetical protein UFOVP48_26 [uncultured Caudovirales phage]|uniref:Uncharacterized protein n=1 Tax=uncultured Caudovirales phage TaxID=2100421 RepID=A0A6J5KML6_9CAUD|nr:hypothetical protein UFOVP48_26 [uncultured Caudovirales phage]
MWFSLTGDRMTEFRYQEAGDEWMMSIYDYGKPTEQSEGRLGNQPAWLQLIIDIAKVGGYMKPLPDGPPDLLLWAKIDDDNKLLEITFP